MKFEYVASGLSHIGVNNSSIFFHPEDPISNIIIQNKLKLMKILDKTEHKFSVLFNAYQEFNLGRDINCTLRKHVKDVYSDSGGLQVVTQGISIDSEFKKKIYDTQAQFSSIAMSFDEIPVEIKGDRSLRTDSHNRFFSYALLKEKATESGINLRDQIDYFRSIGSDCKPMIITQGNDLETYQEWVNIICDVIGPERWQYVSGISSGAAALGSGLLEDVKRYFILGQLQYPDEINRKHIHILGVGSLMRLMPLVPLIENGLFPNDVNLSYDSTTHTGNLTSGQYYIQPKPIDLGRQRNRRYYEALDHINEVLKDNDLPPVKDEHIFLYLCARSEDTYHKNLSDDAKIDKYWAYHTFFYCQLYNFMLDLERLFKDRLFFDEYALSKKIYLQLNALRGVRDYQDFKNWEAKFKPTMKSKSVRSLDEVNTLDRFF